MPSTTDKRQSPPEHSRTYSCCDFLFSKIILHRRNLCPTRAHKPRRKYHEKASITKCLLDAGYSPGTVRQYSNIMRGLRPHIGEVVDWMEEHRLRIAAQMEATIDKASYADLSRSMQGMTESIRLLTGKTTQNIGVIAVERRAELGRRVEE